MMPSPTQEKLSSKPGRKLLTSEPKNKRTAQNRAAQRAFRERKERKLQELEDKVQLLEDEKTQIANESDLLRMQVKSLMSRLASFQQDEDPQKQLLPPSTISSNSTPSDTHDGTGSISSASSIDNWKSPSKLDHDTLDLLNNKQYKDHFNEDVFCNNLNEACGTKENPLPKSSNSKSSLNIKASPLTFNINSSNNSPFEKMNSTLSNEDMGFLFDQGNTVMFENIPDTDLLKNTNFAMDMYNDWDVDLNKDDVFDELMKENELLDRRDIKLEDDLIDTPLPTNTSSFSVGERGGDNKNQLLSNNSLETEYVPNSDESLMKCSQIWDRVTSDPRFTDIDIDGLCNELKQKAKCSEHGVVVNGTDVGDILKTAVEHQRQQKLRNQQNMFLGSTW